MEKKLQYFKLLLAYDGAEYFGWQRTKTGPSIQEGIESVLAKVLQHEVHIEGASRTDRGVHAYGQVAVFATMKNLPDLSKFRLSLNQLLRGSIVVREIAPVSAEFHPTLDARAKIYHYHFCTGSVQLPQFRYHSWHVPYAIREDAIAAASALLIGEKDFSAFCNVKEKEGYSHKRRRVDRIDLIPLSHGRFRFEVQGNHFLYKMVRNIVGTLVYVGIGRIDINEISFILDSKDRKNAGVAAPAYGLTLHGLFYH